MTEENTRPLQSPQRWAHFALLGLLLAWPVAAGIELPQLPEGIASFGAAVAGDDLVVYGGHVGRTHQHSIENLSHRFLRLDLTSPGHGWQSLDAVEGLQGLPMVAYGREVCRVGGLRAHNHVGSEEELHSIAEVRCFDLDQKSWRDLPPLPQARSSHDAVVYDDHLYVAGGWQLRGSDQPAVWITDLAVLDLRHADARWQTVPQPFQRRALAVAAAAGKVVALGGLDTDGTSRRVEIYDQATGAWSTGAELPPMAERMKGFGVSAFGVGERIFLSGADGVVHAFDATENTWQVDLGKLETPRFFHRLLSHRDRLLAIGGAASSGHLDSVEVLEISELKPGAVVAEAATAESGGVPAELASWPGFRGRGDSRAVTAALPLRWSDSENLSWRAKVPGYGQSSPVLWHGQVFVTSVEGPKKATLVLSSFALDTGEVRWRRRFAASQEIASSDMVTRGAPTPVVDEERVYAFFESGDLIAVDHEGESLWQRSLTRDYGQFAGNHGVASSPVLTRDAVVVQVTHDGPSYFLAVEKQTGVTRWKVDRPARVSWTTPVVVAGKHGQEIVSSAAGRVEALSASTGERLWYREGIEKNHAPSVTVDRGLVIVASSATGHNFAVDRMGQGELGDEHVVWRASGVSSGFGSPVVAGDCVLIVNKAGVLTCVDYASGAQSWQHRLGAANWATPIIADDRVYFFSKDGKTTVLTVDRAGPQVLAENSLSTEGTVYGVAAAYDSLLVRTGDELIKLSEPPSGVEAEQRAATLASVSAPADR